MLAASTKPAVGNKICAPENCSISAATQNLPAAMPSVCNKICRAEHWRNRSKILVKSHKMQPQQQGNLLAAKSDKQKSVWYQPLLPQSHLCATKFITPLNIENRKQAGAETKTKTTLCVVTIGISAPLAANCGTKELVVVGGWCIVCF